MAEIHYSYDPDKRRWSFNGFVSDDDLARLDLDHLDRLVISSPVEEPADILQSLELIFRRLHQQIQRENEARQTGLTDAEQKAQGLRCACGGADDMCPCQNVPDATTRRERAGA